MCLKYYTLAEENGDANPLFRLGLMCRDGKGVEQNQEEAEHYFNLVADHGYTGNN